MMCCYSMAGSATQRDVILCCGVLCCIVLCRAVLCCAVLCGAVVRRAMLNYVVSCLCSRCVLLSRAR